MGILRLFSYLKKHYPDIIQPYYSPFKKLPNTPYINKNTYTHTTEWLLLDLNAFIHPVCQKVYGYGNHEKQSDFWRKKKENMSEEELEKMAFNLICKTIWEMVKMNNPSRGLYIAVDGVPGASKQAQQRQRRFKGATGIEDFKSKHYNFHPNHISTGTEFMNRFSKYLYFYIKNQKQRDWKYLQIIYSPVNVPAEGEHKLIRFLDENKYIQNITIASPDADMIMLGLLANCKNVYVFRENVFADEDGDHFFVDITLLKQQILKDIKFISLEHRFIEEYAIKDYVLFSFFIGNDFLPNLNSLEISNKGIEILYQLYVETVTEFGHLIEERGKQWYIRETSFSQLLKRLSDIEIKLIIDKHTKGKHKFPDRLLQKHIVKKDIGNDFELDYINYRKEYYIKKMGIPDDEKFEEKIDEMVDEYLKGVVFVMRYYFKNIPTFSWYYPNHYAPLLSDLYEKGKTKNLNYKFEVNYPLSMYESLLGILPPSSFFLLPNTIRQKLEIKIKLDSDFLEEFEIDLDGKQQEYEGICLLPFVSYDKLKKLFSEVELTEGEKLKNKMGANYRF